MLLKLGLELYQKYIDTNNIEKYNLAKNQAKILLNQLNKNDGGFYCNKERYILGTNIKLSSPWISSRGQGESLSFLSKMYTVEKDKQYIDACELAIKPYMNSIENGGLVSDFLNCKFFKEVSTNEKTYSLTGFLYSLVGLKDYYNISENVEAKKLYDDGVKTLEVCLPYFNYKGNSLYSIGYMSDKKIPNIYYQNYHKKNIELLEEINCNENNIIFEYFIKEWKKNGN